MKIQALIAAVALAVAGGAAFAQTGSSTPSTANSSASTTAAPATGEASTKAAPGEKTSKVMRHHHVVKRHHHLLRHHKKQHVSSADRHAMNSTHHMGASPSPSVSLNSQDRQERMDQAYQDWKKNHG